MKKEIKNPEHAMENTIWKQQKPIVSVIRKILRTKILVSQKLNKINA